MNGTPFPRNTVWFTAALGCLLLTLSTSLPAKQGSIMSNTVTYTSTVADEHFATKLLITPDGLGKLSLGSNRDHRDRSIGQFQQLIPAAMLQNLASTVNGLEFANSPSQQTLVPDESFREIKLITPDQQQTVKMIGEELPTPAIFGKAEQAIQEIINYLQKFPLLSVSMRVLPLPPLVDAGKTVNIDIVLRNLGRTPYFIESPKDWGKQATHCELKAIRSDIPLAELKSQHQVFVQLDGSAFIKPESQQNDAPLGLMPEEQIGLRFQHQIDWAPGQYDIDISLALTVFNKDKKALFIGGMVSPPLAIKVQIPDEKI